MKNFFYPILLLVIVFALSVEAKDPVSVSHDLDIKRIVIEPWVVYQTIDGFGASDAWRTQFVGKNWPLKKREAMADLLFSQDIDKDGNPLGIGLSIWRFYIGSGSMEQGEESGITHPWRRSESFLLADGTYDWNKQQGQQWFLQAAKKHGVDHFLGFAISAPVHMTRNGKAWSPGGEDFNIDEGRIGDFAEFLSQVSGYFHQQGLGFSFISPFNETQWNWEAPASQEGTPALNSEIASLVRYLSPKLMSSSPQTMIVVPESAELQFLYGFHNKQGRDNQIDDFFHPDSENFIGDLPNVKKVVLGHSYFTTHTWDLLYDTRKALQNKLQEYDNEIGFWQSEFCILERHEDIGAGQRRDLGMPTALYVARVIHHDLTIANAKSWSWWTALSQFDFKDGLIYLDNGNDGIRRFDYPDSQRLKYDGYFRESKLLWALGNYSRFVRPGMQRIKAEFVIPLDDVEKAENLMVSAYKDKDDDTLVLVLVNYATNKKNFIIENLGEHLFVLNDQFETYTTSESYNLARSTVNAGNIEIPPRSVVTLVGKMISK